MSDLESRIHFARYMLAVGPMIGATCALLSVYVVLRRMALISEGVSHAGFGGVAVAILLGYYLPFFDAVVPREIVTGIFCLCTALLMGYVTRKKRVSEDSAIGIFLVASMALGVLLIKVRQFLPSNGRPMPVDLEHLLFGDFTNVNQTDVIVAACAMVLVFSIIAALYYQFLYTTLDEEMARVNGVNTRLINTLLLMMISLVIVVCVRMVGFLMITALTIIPGATANLISRKFIGVILAALIVGTLGTFSAIAMGIEPPVSNYPPGAVIVLSLFSIFVAVWLFRHLFKAKSDEVFAKNLQLSEKNSADFNENDPQNPQKTRSFGHPHSH